MNKLRPVKEIMATELITVSTNDPIRLVYEIFQTESIHHLPILEGNKLKGMISKSDLLFFLDGKLSKDDNLYSKNVEKIRLDQHTAKDIMTEGLAKLDEDDPIRTAVALFKLNKFHALPVLKDDKLTGIVTPLDIIKAIDAEEVTLADYTK